jgi:hypothetical protein
VDIPLKLDEGVENTEIKPEVKEGIEVPLRLEEEPEEKGEEVGEMKNKQGLKGRAGANTHRRSAHTYPTRQTYDGTGNIPAGRAYGSRG